MRCISAKSASQAASAQAAGSVLERPTGEMTEHEFKSYGKAAIQAQLAPPGAVLQQAADPAAAAVLGSSSFN